MKMIFGMRALIGGVLMTAPNRVFGSGLLSRMVVSMRNKGGGGGGGGGGVGGVGGGGGVGGWGRGGMVPSYLPKTENQKKFVEYLDDNNNRLVVVLGPAGTGKTLFACVKAIKDLKAGAVNRIVITRPVVTVEEDIGYLPGNLRNKMDPWIRPIFDIFLEYYSQRDIDSMVQSGVIEIAPLAFMRGRTFKRCFILADEMQNSSPNQMLMLLTRIGDGSRMVVGGDLNQSDRAVGGNGLAEFVTKFRGFCFGGGDAAGISICEMDKGDVERSPVVAKVLEIMDSSSGKGNYMDNDSAVIPKKDFYSKNRPLW